MRARQLARGSNLHRERSIDAWHQRHRMNALLQHSPRIPSLKVDGRRWVESADKSRDSAAWDVFGRENLGKQWRTGVSHPLVDIALVRSSWVKAEPRQPAVDVRRVVVIVEMRVAERALVPWHYGGKGHKHFSQLVRERRRGRKRKNMTAYSKRKRQAEDPG
jgi:hypothetical protein